MNQATLLAPMPAMISRDDGYTRDGYINPVDNLHGSLKFKYRPVDITLRAAFMDAMAGKDKEKDQIGLTCQFIASRITVWDAVDVDKQDESGAHPLLPITPESVRVLHPMIYYRLRGICCYGSQAPDIDPDKLPGKTEGMSDDEALKMMLGNSEAVSG